MSPAAARRPRTRRGAPATAPSELRPIRPAFDSPFPPIADLGFLSDCHTGALVTSDGSIEWMCLPHFDSPSVFGALLDRGAGSWRVGPYGVYVPAGRRYLPGTNMIETTWMTPQGWVRVLDALTIGAWHDNEHGSSHTRPPTDYDADHLLVRMIECLQGQVQVEIVCEPMLAYGACAATWEAVEGGPAGLSMLDAGEGERRQRDDRAPVQRHPHGHRGQPRARAPHADQGGEALLRAVVDGGQGRARTRSSRPSSGSQATAQFWRGWLAEGTYPDHPWRIHLERSALALKGLTFMPTGALLAAPTTSLPETPGGERNWDYRYCWMRDATFTLWALHALGLDWEADDFIQYVADMTRGEDGALQIMYGIEGQRGSDRVDARPSRRLRGGAPGADRQRRLQAAPERRLRRRARLGLRARQGARPHPRAAVAGARRPGPLRVGGLARARPGDLGGARRAPPLRLLEADVLGGDGPRRAAGRTARAPRARPRAGRPRPTRSASELLERGVDERGVFRQHYDTDALDASTLLVPLVRFLPPEDERVRATVKAIRDELSEGGLVLRYRPEETDDGLHGSEGTFLICSFWMVSALSRDRRAPRGSNTSASACSPTARRSACTPRSSRPPRAATSATIPRPSPISR